MACWRVGNRHGWVLPLELGLSLEQTAQAIGVSVGWACQLRTRFVRAGGVPDSGRARKGGRRHENMTRDEEVALLARQSRYVGS